MKRAKAIGWSVGGQLLTTLASLASTVILARLLHPADYGVFAYALAIYSTTQWLLQAGMGQYVLSAAELTQEKLNGAFAVASLQGLIGALIVAILAPAAGWFGSSATIGWVTLTVAIVPLLNAPEGISDSYWVRSGRFRQVALLQIAKATLQTIVSVAIEISLHWGAFSLVAGLLASSFLSCSVAFWVLIGEAGARPIVSFEQWKILRRFGARSFALTVGQAGSAQFPIFVIGRFLGLDALGYYNRASAALETIANTLIGATARVAIPRFFSQVNGGRPHREAVAEFQEMILFINWPALSGLAVLAGPIISILYGPKWGAAAYALPFLCLACAIDQARAGGMETLLSHDRIGLNAKIEVGRSLYVLLLMVIGAQWGFFGVLCARVADSLITFAIYSTAMARLDSLPHRIWPKLFASNIAMTAAACLPAVAFMRHWHWPNVLGVCQFAVAIGASVLAWAITILLVRHPYAVAARDMVGARLARRSA